MPIIVRSADAADMSFLTDMLVQAAFWRPGEPQGTAEDVLDDPDLAHYIVGWPRAGDLGVVAVEGDTDSRVGAAWLRHFSAVDSGYGFVDEAIPEISMGVVYQQRGRGVGGCLLQALINAARNDGIAALSLSVEPDNYALRLYENFGFIQVSQRDGSQTMRLHL